LHSFPFMGRTLPSIRQLLREEIEAWKPMRNFMKDPEDRKLFDEMMKLCYAHASELSVACSPIPMDYILVGICFELFKKAKTGKFTYEKEGLRPMLEDFDSSEEKK
jgi:hypothetical protein